MTIGSTALLCALLCALSSPSLTESFSPIPTIADCRVSRVLPTQRRSFLDDVLGGVFGAADDDDSKNGSKKSSDVPSADTTPEEIDADLELDMGAFQARKQEVESSSVTPAEDFDGYAMRDVIYDKWGKCYDVDFNKVSSFGFREVYLNVYPFHLGGRRFRHESELDYLCHLQAVVEILQKYNQLDSVIYQILSTDKKPKMGSPLKAVPIRLDLSEEEVNKIIGY